MTAKLEIVKWWDAIKKKFSSETTEPISTMTISSKFSSY
jgi:hypothetical protein